MEIKQKGLYTHHTLSDRERENLIILELIRKKGPITKPDISNLTGIDIASVSNSIKKYISEKIAVERGSGGEDRKTESVELDAKGISAIGIDIGQENIVGTLTDLSVKAIEKMRLPRRGGDKKETARLAVGLARDLIAKANADGRNVRAIGFGASDDKVYSASETLAKELGIDTFFGSDAACAAFGEKMLNPDADAEDLLYMHSDVGCGIVIKGDIYFGAGGSAGGIQFAGEHTSKEGSILLEDAKYLRPWGADLGITEAAKNEVKRGIGTRIVELASGRIENVTKEVVIEAARENDEIALVIIQNAGMNLGIRIAYLINLFNPEIVVVGGGVEKAGELLLGPIRKIIKKLSFSKAAESAKIIPSALGEDAVTLGAAALAVREIFLKA